MGRGPVYKPGDWNTVQVIIDADIIRAAVNSGFAPGAGVTEDESEGFGPIALYVGGAGEARFRDVGWKDLGVKEEPVEKLSSSFRMQRLNEYYYSWGIAAADINRDGVQDLVTGGYYYLGPDYTKRREIYATQTFNPSTQYAGTSWLNFAYDSPAMDGRMW